MELAPFEGKQVMASHWPATCTVVAFEGAVRSSKTIVSIMAWAKFIRQAERGNLAMIGVTLDTILRNVILPMQEIYGTTRVTFNRGLGEASIFGRLVYLVGADNIRALKKIQGLTLVGAYVDEASNMPEPVFEMLETRLSEPGAWMILTCNPEGPKHWLLKRLKRARWWIQRDSTRVINTQRVQIDGEPHDPLPWMRVTFVLEDNVWLCRTNPTYVANIKASKTGVFYRRMILAEWASADGMVYPSFSEERHTITADQLPRIERVLVAALDYGQNHKTRGYLFGMGRYTINARTGRPEWGARQPGELYRERWALFVLSEYAPASMTVGEHVKGFETWLNACAQAWGSPEWIAVDPAAKPFKTEMFSRGHSNVINARNAVLPGIQTVEALMMSGGLFIVRENCPQLVTMIPAYMWDTKASERGVTAVVKENDDEADALRYGIYTSWRDWRGLIPLAHTPDMDLEEAA